MNALHKQLVLNKKEDWEGAMQLHTTFVDDCITLSPGMSYGLICRPALDSRETAFLWGRVLLQCKLPPDSLIRTYAYASDSLAFEGGPSLDTFLGRRRAENPETMRILHGLFTPVCSSEDFYVNLTGRYLWLMFELIAAEIPPVLEKVHIHMAGDHMVDYLPAIYRNGADFTKRFLSVFDSFYMDMEKRIYDLPRTFDYENTDRQMLEQLAQWVCVDTEGLGQEEIAARIRTAISDWESLYTLKGVKRSVQRLTGRVPYIIESGSVDPNSPACVHAALYRRLYGENPYKFFILLGEDSFSSRAEIDGFISKMKELIPAGTEFELVLLKPCTQLDWHTYLGVNTVVRDYTPTVIDEGTAIHYDMMIGGDEREGKQHFSN